MREIELGGRRMKRSLVAICVAIALILGLSSAVSAAEPPKKPITPPQLKEITFIHYAGPDRPGRPQPSPVDNSAYELLGVFLPDTVTYYVNPSGAPVGALAEIESAFETWDAVTGTELFNPALQTTVSGLSLDGQNTISWVGIVPTSIIAMTRMWYSDDGAIVEFDIVFNALLKWGIDPDNEGRLKLKNAYDVQNIATHEAGHVVGLADLYEDQYRELTMYGYGSKGETIKISLEEGDIAGTRYLYGL
jgi:hypothetical protein